MPSGVVAAAKSFSTPRTATTFYRPVSVRSPFFDAPRRHRLPLPWPMSVHIVFGPPSHPPRAARRMLRGSGRIAILPLVHMWHDEYAVVVFVHGRGLCGLCVATRKSCTVGCLLQEAPGWNVRGWGCGVRQVRCHQ
ncbi:hypothetical protein GGX14DRAFT_578505 [Mycena pura]|uniref:Uncharacterized protein n=1 Tax=Mycena pura TaxID=153505 RepID=A0AAD6Y323_9AGAR|nr:hypothetical protein GGX14DRAFT_578505 [Mycena pura]